MLLRAILVAALSSVVCVGADNLTALIESLVAANKVVGAQVLIGEGDRVLIETYHGVVAPRSGRLVDADTRFCIGSTSKPLASAMVLSLADEGKLSLDEPINHRLPEFSAGPTLRQLLSHHGGIYSQRDGLSDTQRRWIRDFRLTLPEAVKGISGEKTAAKPGERFAYSGAGYCVIGRVAEVAAQADVSELLSKHVTGPLGMDRTTYFPAPDDTNVATGVSGETPHLLGDQLLLPLIGGSIYSTVRDLSRFARMMIGRGALESVRVLTRERWREMITRPKFSKEPYALGWGLREEPMRIRHGGALATSRAILDIDLASGRYAVVLYSLTEQSQQVQSRINKAVVDSINR